MKEKEETKKWMILILFAVTSYYIINNLNVVWNVIKVLFDVLLPFILGGALAFILNIPMTKIENTLNKKIQKDKIKKYTRIISITISLIIFLGVIGLIAFLIIPELIESIESLISNIPSLVSDIENFILKLLKEHTDIQLEIKEIFKNINASSILSNLLNYVINGSLTFIGSLISSIVTIFMAIIFSIYMLSQKEYLIRGFKKVTNAYLDKKKSNKIFEICTLANKTFSKFISGQCVDAIILGSLLFIVLTIFKFPYALLISVLTCVTALIPIFGALIAMVVGVILIGISNPLEALLFIVIFQIVQQIEGNFVYPKVVGASVGLSPLWTLFAITVGGNLCGIIGMLIGLPIASIAYAIFRNNVNNRLKQKELLKENI
jgi:predicted PurR-regulated permease PerM